MFELQMFRPNFSTVSLHILTDFYFTISSSWPVETLVYLCLFFQYNPQQLLTKCPSLNQKPPSYFFLFFTKYVVSSNYFFFLNYSQQKIQLDRQANIQLPRIGLLFSSAQGFVSLPTKKGRSMHFFGDYFCPVVVLEIFNNINIIIKKKL